MDKQEAILAIKETLKKLMSFEAAPTAPAEAPAEKKFKSFKLKDGSELSIVEGTELGVGIEVFKTDETGNQIPVEDGDYELEDGKKITVKGGKVEAISDSGTPKTEDSPQAPATSEPAPVTQADANTPVAKPTDTPAEGGAAIEDRLTALENQIAQILEILQGMGSMQEVAMKKINEIAGQPATESIKLEKQVNENFSNFSSFRDEMAEIKELRSKFNMDSNYSFEAKK